MIKAIIYGIGSMGKIMTKYMVGKGVTIVGAIDNDPSILGKDLGEVVGLGRHLNVTISNNSTKVLATQQADIAVLSLYSEVDKMYPFFKECIINGLNVISTSRESSYPWTVSPSTASKLDKMAKKNDVTISASGYQDIYMVNMVSLLSGSCQDIKSITIKSKYNVNDFGKVVAQDMHVGETKEEFYKGIKKQGIKPSYVRFCIEAIVSDLGLSIKEYKQRTDPKIEKHDVECTTLDTIVKQGMVSGLVETVEVDTEQGIKFYGKWTGKVYSPSEENTNECFIEGTPNIYSKNDKVDQKITTCTQIVNRIPDIINSKPGYVTYEKMPKLKFRNYPLSSYLNI